MKTKISSKPRVLSHFVAPEAAAFSVPGVRRANSPRGFVPEGILVALDFSRCSEKALEYAVPFARQFGAELVLLHVVQSYVPLSEFEPNEPALVAVNTEST